MTNAQIAAWDRYAAAAITALVGQYEPQELRVGAHDPYNKDSADLVDGYRRGIAEVAGAIADEMFTVRERMLSAREKQTLGDRP